MTSIDSIANAENMQLVDGEYRLNEGYYKTVIYDLTRRFIDELYPDAKKITGNHLLAVMGHIYETLFKPDNTTWTNTKCNIPYNEYNIQTLYNIYLKLYRDYLCMPSMYSFSCMTGLDEGTIDKYVTRAKSEITKNRKELVQNKLYDTPLGVTVLANNDQDTGLMYNRQNMIERETVKQGLTLNDFVKISQKHDE